MRPLLLIDVDGVLSPTGGSVPPAYERRTTSVYEVVVCPDHADWLNTQSELFDLVWVTTWGDRANQIYAPLLRLPELPVLPLPDLPRAGTRKLAAVKSYVGDRDFAWVDDELYEDADAWANSRAA